MTKKSFVCLSTRNDLLRISPAERTLENVVVESIAKAWPRGLQASQRKLHDQVAEYKLHGEPWFLTGVFDVLLQGAPLILVLVRGFSRAGFRLQTSIDMSRSSIDTHAIVLRRSPPIDLSEPSALFRLFGNDIILAYEAPFDLCWRSRGDHRQALEQGFAIDEDRLGSRDSSCTATFFCATATKQSKRGFLWPTFTTSCSARLRVLCIS